MPAFHQRAPLGRQSHASLVGSATCLLVMEAVTLGHLELSGHRASEDSAVQARGDEGRAGVYKLQEIITGPDAEKGFAKKILFMEYFLLIAAKSQPKRPCSVLKPCCPFRGTLKTPYIMSAIGHRWWREDGSHTPHSQTGPEPSQGPHSSDG